MCDSVRNLNNHHIHKITDKLLQPNILFLNIDIFFLLISGNHIFVAYVEAYVSHCNVMNESVSVTDVHSHNAFINAFFIYYVCVYICIKSECESDMNIMSGSTSEDEQ